jgi:chromosome segregation ATPase
MNGRRAGASERGSEMGDTDRERWDGDDAYTGEGISVRTLEETIRTERARQNDRLGELARMRARNAEIQQALAVEMGRLRELSERLSEDRKDDRGRWRRLLDWFRGRGGRTLDHRSIEQLLREQYETSSLRLKEAAEFVERLEAAKKDLYDEIERLNGRIVESAQNEERAAALVTRLRTLKGELEARLMRLDPASAEGRKYQAELDRVRRGLAEHTTRLRLYSTAEDRLAGLKGNTWKLAEVIANLQDQLNLAIQKVGATSGLALVMEIPIMSCFRAIMLWKAAIPKWLVWLTAGRLFSMYSLSATSPSTTRKNRP